MFIIAEEFCGLGAYKGHLAPKQGPLGTQASRSLFKPVASCVNVLIQDVVAEARLMCVHIANGERTMLHLLDDDLVLRRRAVWPKSA